MKAFSDFKDLKLSRKDSSLLIIVTKVLHKNKVTVQSKPTDIDSAKTWVTEYEKASSAFNRILKDVQKKKPPGDTAFFDSSQYTVFAKVQRPKLKATRGRPRKVISPEKSDDYRQFKERSESLRAHILKFCKEEGIKAGPCIAKVGSMILHDTSLKEHYDPSSGAMFHKISEGLDPFEASEVHLKMLMIVCTL